MAGLGYKDFTAGAVLTAAQVDGYLMEQAVMNFAGTAARGSALSSVQSAGMMAHVGGGTVTVYDGSAWQQVYPASAGLTFVAGTAFSAVSSVSVNNCFTSSFENYRLLLAVTGLSADLSLTFRLRASGSDNNTSNYVGERIRATSVTAAAVENGVTTSWDIGTIDGPTSAFRYVSSFDIFGPQAANRTLMTGIIGGFESAGGPRVESVWFSFSDVTQFDGLSVIASTGNITGSIRVYGYRNS